MGNGAEREPSPLSTATRQVHTPRRRCDRALLDARPSQPQLSPGRQPPDVGRLENIDVLLRVGPSGAWGGVGGPSERAVATTRLRPASRPPASASAAPAGGVGCGGVGAGCCGVGVRAEAGAASVTDGDGSGHALSTSAIRSHSPSSIRPLLSTSNLSKSASTQCQPSR